jgi:hypothetical protein
MMNFGLLGIAIDRGAIYICTHGLFASHAIIELSPPQRYPIEMSAAWGTEVRPWQPLRHIPGLWVIRLWFIALVYAGLLAYPALPPTARRRGKRGFDVTAEASAKDALEPPAPSRV